MHLIWRAKREFEESNGVCVHLTDFLYVFLHRKHGQPKAIAEAAYNLLYTLHQHACGCGHVSLQCTCVRLHIRKPCLGSGQRPIAGLVGLTGDHPYLPPSPPPLTSPTLPHALAHTPPLPFSLLADDPDCNLFLRVFMTEVDEDVKVSQDGLRHTILELMRGIDTRTNSRVGAACGGPGPLWV